MENGGSKSTSTGQLSQLAMLQAAEKGTPAVGAAEKVASFLPDSAAAAAAAAGASSKAKSQVGAGLHPSQLRHG